MMHKKVNTLEALAVAEYAMIVNNNQIIRVNDSVRKPNLQYLFEHFGIDVHAGSVPVTDSLLTVAEDIKKYFEYYQVMATLKSVRVSKFQTKIVELISRPTVSSKDFGLLIWAPKVYADVLRRDSAKQLLLSKAHSSRHLGQEGEKITVDFTLVEQRYVRAWLVYSALGYDAHGNIIRFMSKHKDRCATGRYSARVKDHWHDHFLNGAQITILNHVRPAK